MGTLALGENGNDPPDIGGKTEGVDPMPKRDVMRIGVAADRHQRRADHFTLARAARKRHSAAIRDDHHGGGGLRAVLAPDLAWSLLPRVGAGRTRPAYRGYATVIPGAAIRCRASKRADRRILHVQRNLSTTVDTRPI